MTGGLANRDKPIVLVGLMGAGKTCIGRRLARRLGMTFVDADEEIVKAAGAERKRNLLHATVKRRSATANGASSPGFSARRARCWRPAAAPSSTRQPAS